MALLIEMGLNLYIPENRCYPVATSIAFHIENID
jgi:hypothetical protein